MTTAKSRYYGVERDRSERLSAAGTHVQRRLALVLLTYVSERHPLDLIEEARLALTSGGQDTAQLRERLGATSDATGDQEADLNDEIAQKRERGEPVSPEDETRSNNLGSLIAAYDTAYAALDPNPDLAAQEAAYSATYATSREEVTALFEATLREQ